jgi:hypothetical protein
MSTKLSREEIEEIHGAVPVNPLFSNTFLFVGKYNTRLTVADHVGYQMATWIDAPPKQPVSNICPQFLRLLLTRGSRISNVSDTWTGKQPLCS